MECLYSCAEKSNGEIRPWNSSTEIQLGGTWLPQSCVARQRVAVIIPFRDRNEHLATLLPVLHTMLRSQLLHYTVYVVEQVEPCVWCVIQDAVLLQGEPCDAAVNFE